MNTNEETRSIANEETRIANEETRPATDETRLADDETRVSDDDTRRAKEDDETVVANDDTLHADDDTIVPGENHAAPVSRESISRKKIAQRVAFGAAGFAVGTAGAIGISAMASTSEPKADESSLAAAATPDDEMTPEEYADSTASRVDPSVNPVTDENRAQPTEIIVEDSTEMHAQRETHITTPNPIGNTPSHRVSADSTASHSDNTPSVSAESADKVDAAQEIHPVVEAQHAQPAQDAQPAEDAVDGTIPTQQDIILENENGIRVAHVDEDQNFAEAFTQARAQVGPGGVFTWHGNTYGTYYAEEWHQMDADDRQEFIKSVDLPQDDIQESAADIDVNVESIGTIALQDGTVINHATVNIDGTQASFIDADNDGTIDVAVVDSNGDGVLDQNDQVVDLSDSGLTMDDIAAQMANGTPNDMTMEDFSNDVNLDY
jgi:hypothetical protein